MSTATTPYYFRRRTIGRAASPPTWACYEQIPYDDDDCSDSGSESCSEDDEDYSRAAAGRESTSDSENSDHLEDGSERPDDSLDMDMEIDKVADGAASKKSADSQKDVKGKQRAVEPIPETTKQRRRKHRDSVYTLRPILTIQKSQGFVWNQDLFVPPYIKDRYVASTSPPNSRGFISTSVPSANPAAVDYEVEVVEIRVQEGELDDIIP